MDGKTPYVYRRVGFLACYASGAEQEKERRHWLSQQHEDLTPVLRKRSSLWPGTTVF